MAKGGENLTAGGLDDVTSAIRWVVLTTCHGDHHGDKP